jgi:hypothetical protein
MSIAQFGIRLIASQWRPSEMNMMSGKLKAYAVAAVARLRILAPYAAIELILPGGSVMALLLWLYRRQKKLPGFAASLNALW